jgi:hypothetical protein
MLNPFVYQVSDICRKKYLNKLRQQKYAKNNLDKRAIWNKNWIANNREQYNKSKAEYRFRLKISVLSMYCEDKICCKNCGYDSNIDALCLDHIENNGAEHRKELRISSRNNSNGTTIYERIKAQGKIEGLQVLCFNCNTIKELERKRNGVSSKELIANIGNKLVWKNIDYSNTQ